MKGGVVGGAGPRSQSGVRAQPERCSGGREPITNGLGAACVGWVLGGAVGHNQSGLWGASIAGSAGGALRRGSRLQLVSERFTIWSHLIWLAIFWNECGRCRASRSDRRLLLRLRVRGRGRVAWRVAGSGRVLDLVALLLHRADLAAADMGGDRSSASRARARVLGRSRAFGRGGGHSVVT